MAAIVSGTFQELSHPERAGTGWQIAFPIEGQLRESEVEVRVFCVGKPHNRLDTVLWQPGNDKQGKDRGNPGETGESYCLRGGNATPAHRANKVRIPAVMPNRKSQRAASVIARLQSKR